jgi:hypothetical protein
MAVRPPFTHIKRLSDGRGIFEHADGSTPRTKGGYCLDDVSRALIVLCREPHLTNDLNRLAAVYFDFILDSQGRTGKFHNRLDVDGHWLDEPETGDWWGRGMWSLGTAAALSSDSWIRATAISRFDRGAAERSPDLRAMSFAALGAAEILARGSNHGPARQILVDTVARIGPIDMSAAWPWPEPRLAYANAAIPEALIAAGEALDDPAVRQSGLDLLAWLLDTESYDGHLSVTPVGGRGPDEPQPAYDQQPLEVAALADACNRASNVTGEPRWSAALELAVAWFLGSNDKGLVMWDESTGGGFDALTATGRNTNQGAESTLAMVATLQHAHRLSATSR